MSLHPSLPWDVELPGLGGGVPAHGRGLERDEFLGPFQHKQFYGSMFSNPHDSKPLLFPQFQTLPHPPWIRISRSPMSQPAVTASLELGPHQLADWLGGC